MAARWLKPKGRHVFAMIAMLFVVPVSVAAQSGSVTLQGRVSETVALSIAPTFTQGDLHMQVVTSGGNMVRITLSGDDASPVIRLPLLVRSNSGFKVSATFESQTAVLTQLSVVDARPTGSLVSPLAVNALVVRPEVEPDLSKPLLVLSGPRVSLGGSLDSSNNALEVTLLIRMSAESGRPSVAHLTFTATAGPPIQ